MGINAQEVPIPFVVTSRERYHDITGYRFRHLTVVCRVRAAALLPNGTRSRWLCLCDCGQVRWVNNARKLIIGEIKSCGCIKDHRRTNVANPLTNQIIQRRLDTEESAAEIGRFFGVTKNTVIGVLYRAGMIGFTSTEQVVKHPIVFPGTNRCLYPYGDPGVEGFHFCGARTEPEQSYCGEHFELTHSKEKLLPIAVKTDPNVVKKKAAA